MRYLSVIILFAIVTSLYGTNSDRTTRSRLRVKPVEDAAVADTENRYDTIAPDSQKIIVAGYDKPLTSRKETFFVTNGYDRAIAALEIELKYYDMSGRQLHSANRWISCDVPQGETRQLNIPSWDKQLSFYFYQSVKPRRQATPYKVSCRVLKCVFLTLDSVEDSADNNL